MEELVTKFVKNPAFGFLQIKACFAFMRGGSSISDKEALNIKVKCIVLLEPTRKTLGKFPSMFV